MLCQSRQCLIQEISLYVFRVRCTTPTKRKEEPEGAHGKAQDWWDRTGTE